MNPVKISIVIPVYNSSDCILELNKALQTAFADFNDYELILINDKSKDNSWEKIQEISSVNDKITGISLRKNFGQDAAIMAGLRISKGEYAVIMDDDLQHAPADIFKLYDECRKGYDVCYALFPDKKQSDWKNIGSWLNGKISEKLLNKPKEIYLSPFKIIKREVVDEILKYAGPYPYIDATLLTITSNVTQTEVEHHDRFRGQSNYTLLRSTLVFIKHVTNYSIYPLRLVTVTGFTAAIISFILGILYLAQYLFGSQHKVEGWITIVILLTFFGGLILMCLGLIGEYIGRIFISVNNKPQYTIDKVINKKDIIAKNIDVY
jgi:undecaprenyl-phosphate 4-deoxy-4-formamido-L-arabinose transferase